MKNSALVIYFAILLWLIEIVNFFSGHRFNSYGIIPRTLKGIVGIPLSPLLHASFTHLIMNTVPLIILGLFISMHGKRLFLRSTIYIITVGGAGLWLFGRSAYHVGASGLIFGYFGYLVAKGCYDRKLSSLIISGITLFLYGGIVWGVIPTFGHISWEAHLSGLIAGVFAAKQLRG